MSKKETNSTKPAQQFRLRGIAVSVFANAAKDRKTPFYKTSIQKTYHDGNDFRTTNSLGRDDLPVTELLLKKAWVWILNQEAESRKSSGSDAENSADEDN